MSQLFAALLLPAAALAQFGNLYVDWTKKGEGGGAPDDLETPTRRGGSDPEANAGYETGVYTPLDPVAPPIAPPYKTAIARERERAEARHGRR